MVGALEYTLRALLGKAWPATGPVGYCIFDAKNIAPEQYLIASAHFYVADRILADAFTHLPNSLFQIKKSDSWFEV